MQKGASGGSAFYFAGYPLRARSGHLLVSKIFAQYLGQSVGIGLRRHEPQILAVAADQVDDAGMVDRVVPAPFVLHLHVKRLVGVGDLSNFVWRASKSHQAAMK